MSRIGRIGLMCLIGMLAPLARADISAALAEATKPLLEGVPEVAVVRLRVLLDQSSSDAAWCAIAEKLAEAQFAAKQPAEALALLANPRLREFEWAKFWRAQVLASLHRWADALPFYEELAATPTSRFHSAATFGAAEALRALERSNEALAKLTSLVHDKEWGTRAQFRLAELYIGRADATNAQRVLNDIKPQSMAERKERRLLRGRVELILRRPERAISAFQAAVQKPEDTPHETLVTALVGMADAHLQLRTPESGDDVIEQFMPDCLFSLQN